MIIGHGDIGSILQDREGACFFAAGVSNSQIKNNGTGNFEFEREIKLLTTVPTDLCLFYFSTLSIYFKESPYVQHKRHMEQLIRDRFENYNVIRIGNIEWGDNPNTFVNYFRRMIAQNKPYKVLDEYRYLISKEELLLLTNNLPLVGRNEINVTGRIVKVQQVVNELLNGKKSVHQIH